MKKIKKKKLEKSEYSVRECHFLSLREKVTHFHQLEKLVAAGYKIGMVEPNSTAKFEGLHPWKQDVKGKKWKNKTPVRTTGKDEEIKLSHNATF